MLHSDARGDVAQLGEHRVRIAGVRGSSPLISTNSAHRSDRSTAVRDRPIRGSRARDSLRSGSGSTLRRRRDRLLRRPRGGLCPVRVDRDGPAPREQRPPGSDPARGIDPDRFPHLSIPGQRGLVRRGDGGHRPGGSAPATPRAGGPGRGRDGRLRPGRRDPQSRTAAPRPCRRADLDPAQLLSQRHRHGRRVGRHRRPAGRPGPPPLADPGRGGGDRGDHRPGDPGHGVASRQ